MKKSIEINGNELEYDLERKNVKNLNLRIKADQSIHVSANSSVSEQSIEQFLHDKSDYILNALEKYREMAKYVPKPKLYVDGESFKILGRDLRLKVVSGKQNKVVSDETYIVLTVKDPCDFVMKQKTMDKWLKKQCQMNVRNVCESVYPKFQKYGVDFPQIRFRNMISRWGSCQPKRKTLTFNTSLIEAPLSCIEYVVTHEFVHFLQPNHSRKFYQYLIMFMPDWKERKNMLEKTYCYYE